MTDRRDQRYVIGRTLGLNGTRYIVVGVVAREFIGETTGSFAVLLACIGLYGVVANAVTRRINEIGIRMALGASRRSIVTTVVVDVIRVVLAGLAVGAPLTIIARSMIASHLYDVAVTDRATIAVAVITLAGVASLPGFFPAYRAARVDPSAALRYD